MEFHVPGIGCPFCAAGLAPLSEGWAPISGVVDIGGMEDAAPDVPSVTVPVGIRGGFTPEKNLHSAWGAVAAITGHVER